MSDTLVQPPRFRSTARLVQWVRRHRPTSRLPLESERCFFRSKEAPERVSNHLVEYAVRVGELGPDLESILHESCVVTYARNLCRAGKRPSELVLNKIRHKDLVYFSGYWCQFHGRLPESMERKFTDPISVAEYASNVGGLPDYLEEMVLQDGDATMKYINALGTRDLPIPEKFFRALVGHDHHFCTVAEKYFRGRLPSYLEESIHTPDVALNYARRIIKGRLPEVVEQRAFLMKPHMAVRYAFEVVRGFASVRLPDALHNSLLLHGGDDPEIRRYIEEERRLSENVPVAGEGNHD